MKYVYDTGLGFCIIQGGAMPAGAKVCPASFEALLMERPQSKTYAQLQAIFATLP